MQDISLRLIKSHSLKMDDFSFSATGIQADALVDMNSSLWKVETIGDAFMVASGLEVKESSRDLLSGHLSGSTESDARAAIAFGRAAIREAQSLTMPNG